MFESFRFEIADNIVECSGDFTSYIADIRNFFSDYPAASDSATDFEITVSREDIENARRMLSALPVSYIMTDFDYEISAIYEKLIRFFAAQDILFVHGSAVAVDGNAFIFTAESGTGKSTHRALWQKLLGDRVTVLNDDKPFIKVCDDVSYVYGSPLSGKEHIHANTSARLKAICLLERGTENSIEKISFEEALPGYMPSIRFYKNPALDMRVLDCIDRIGKNTEFYRLRCRPDIEAAETAYLALTNSRTVSE